MITAVLIASALLALAALGIAFVAERHRSAGLRMQLEASNGELEHLQRACSRLAPDGVVQRLIDAGAAAGGVDPMAPERKIATALFADLVGYTALSEQLEPATLARVLNGYFQRMSDAIHEHRGHVSTFLGDGILAYFGALRADPWQCSDAVSAALAMRAAMADYNRELAAEGLPAVGVGIGVHRGPGLAGLIGSRERMEFGFVGRTVNVAARVQGLTRVHGVDILVTEEVREGLDGAFDIEAMPAEQVKGIAGRVVTYAVRGRAPAGVARPAAAAEAADSADRGR
jgi:class 3 adenylate cyclase